MTAFFIPALWDSCCLELFNQLPASELVTGTVLSHAPNLSGGRLSGGRLTGRSCRLGRCRHIFQNRNYGCWHQILKKSQNRFLTHPSRLWTGGESYYFFHSERTQLLYQNKLVLNLSGLKTALYFLLIQHLLWVLRILQSSSKLWGCSGSKLIDLIKTPFQYMLSQEGWRIWKCQLKALINKYAISHHNPLDRTKHRLHRVL